LLLLTMRLLLHRLQMWLLLSDLLKQMMQKWQRW
jgi:hypothetical protein